MIEHRPSDAMEDRSGPVFAGLRQVEVDVRVAVKIRDPERGLLPLRPRRFVQQASQDSGTGDDSGGEPISMDPAMGQATRHQHDRPTIRARPSVFASGIDPVR